MRATDYTRYPIMVEYVEHSLWKRGTEFLGKKWSHPLYRWHDSMVPYTDDMNISRFEEREDGHSTFGSVKNTEG